MLRDRTTYGCFNLSGRSKQASSWPGARGDIIVYSSHSTSRYVKLARIDISTKQVHNPFLIHFKLSLTSNFPFLFSFPSVSRLGQWYGQFADLHDQHATVYRCPYQHQSINMAPNRSAQRSLLLGATLGLAQAIALPDPTAVPAKVEVRAPIVTPAAIRFDDKYSYVQKRDILDDIKSGVEGVAKSWGSVLGTDLPSFFTEGKLLM